MNLLESTINFSFEKPILNNIKKLQLKPNVKLNYTNESHLNYFQEIKKDNYNIHFNGIYKDNYFIILIDYNNPNIKNSVYDKHIIITKLNWHLTKIKDDLYLRTIDIKYNKNYKYFYMPLRKYLENNNDISIDDILQINKCIHYDLKLSNNNGFFSLFI